MTNSLQRLNKHTISEVFDYIDATPKNGQRVKFHGHLIHFTSVRLLNFRVNGIKCVNCRVQGAFFALERHGRETPHLNLYGFDKQGKDILMTRDHIRPQSKGGSNALYNSQPMCTKCNGNKDNLWTFKTKVRYYISKFKHWVRRN